MKRKEAIEQADFSLKVQGFSMFPLLQDSDIVFVRKQNTVEDGQTVPGQKKNDQTLTKKEKGSTRSLLLLYKNGLKFCPILADLPKSDKILLIVSGVTLTAPSLCEIEWCNCTNQWCTSYLIIFSNF